MTRHAPLGQIDDCRALALDVFGTILDLSGSLKPEIAKFLQAREAEIGADEFWSAWRHRQRIEQYQDSLLMLGHSGYLETARRGFVYCLDQFGIRAPTHEIGEFMSIWDRLRPFPDVSPVLPLLAQRYRMVVLSNGEPEYLDHLVRNRICFQFDEVISVEVAGAFKPHPAVYRTAASLLKLELGEIIMISSNSFDVLGARACGMRAAFVNREKLPYEDSPFRPDITVSDFRDLDKALP